MLKEFWKFCKPTAAHAALEQLRIIISKKESKTHWRSFYDEFYIRMHCSFKNTRTTHRAVYVRQLFLIKFHQIIKKDEFYCCLYRALCVCDMICGMALKITIFMIIIWVDGDVSFVTLILSIMRLSLTLKNYK